MKAPSILTVLVILLLVICVLFVCYCFCIIFCFGFKCGLFRRPKVIIITHLQSSSTDSGLLGAENASTSASSTLSQSSVGSSRRRPPPSHKKKSTRHQRSRTRSPTARVYSNKHQRGGHAHTDTDNYVDIDTDNSPFLIPPELTEQVQQRVNRTLNNEFSGNRQSTSSFRANSLNATYPSSSCRPSAPLATADLNSDLVAEETGRHRSNLMNPVMSTSLSSSTTSSLGFGASLMEVITASSNVDTLNSSQVLTSVAHTHTNYYHDEKPPSYDDIIRRNY